LHVASSPFFYIVFRNDESGELVSGGKKGWYRSGDCRNVNKLGKKHKPRNSNLVDPMDSVTFVSATNKPKRHYYTWVSWIRLL